MVRIACLLEIQVQTKDKILRIILHPIRIKPIHTPILRLQIVRQVMIYQKNQRLHKKLKNNQKKTLRKKKSCRTVLLRLQIQKTQTLTLRSRTAVKVVPRTLVGNHNKIKITPLASTPTTNLATTGATLLTSSMAQPLLTIKDTSEFSITTT